MMTKIKICGITCRDDAMAACDAGADALGFVLAPEARKRNRYIDADAAASIIAQLPTFVITVGVVVNEPIERLHEYLAVFDRLQLHGDESPGLCASLGARAYKAFQVHSELTLDTVLTWPGELCLLDAWSTEDHGGTGHRCDWRFAAEAARQKKIILAGGLGPENVKEAILLVQPYAVDASGSLESAPGKKNHERIYTFINNVRKASLS